VQLQASVCNELPLLFGSDFHKPEYAGPKRFPKRVFADRAEARYLVLAAIFFNVLVPFLDEELFFFRAHVANMHSGVYKALRLAIAWHYAQNALRPWILRASIFSSAVFPVSLR
jgi:hypothetical protein